MKYQHRPGLLRLLPVSPADLARHFPEQFRKQYHRFVYFICGPEPLMDAMEELLPELGIPRDKVFSERFGM